jgi:trans-2,3-dihydro-3-hydroxyanthranilate isomerase
MPSLPYSHLDVFTDRPFSGNGLAVVHGADNVSVHDMQRFALETRLTETCFVQEPTEADADYRNRIFMPAGEIAFGGHPSLGTAVAVARAMGHTEVTVVQQTLAGCHAIEVECVDPTLAYASMTVPRPRLGAVFEPEQLADGLGLRAVDFHPELPLQLVPGGLSMVIVPLASQETLVQARLCYPVLAEALSRIGADAAYLTHVGDRPSRAPATARAFAADPRVGEDPATGVAAVALSAYAAHHLGASELVIHQGAEMGRPSVIKTVTGQGTVSLGGPVVTIITGTLHL